VSTGIAPTVLAGGRTTHSTFKIPLLLNATSTWNLNLNTEEAKAILQSIWDVAPMTHVHDFQALDKTTE
jgi:hypothetical protein